MRDAATAPANHPEDGFPLADLLARLDGDDLTGQRPGLAAVLRHVH